MLFHCVSLIYVQVFAYAFLTVHSSIAKSTHPCICDGLSGGKIYLNDRYGDWFQFAFYFLSLNSKSSLPSHCESFIHIYIIYIYVSVLGPFSPGSFHPCVPPPVFYLRKFLPHVKYAVDANLFRLESPILTRAKRATNRNNVGEKCRPMGENP